MTANLQFYGIALFLGFMFSLPFRKEKKIEKWKLCLVIAVPLVCASIGSFDAEKLIQMKHVSIIKTYGVMLICFPAYFFVVWDTIWRIINKYTIG